MAVSAIIAAAPTVIQAGSSLVGTVGGWFGGDDQPNGCTNYRAGRYTVESVAAMLRDPVRRKAVADVMRRAWPDWPTRASEVERGAWTTSSGQNTASWLFGVASGTSGGGCSSGDQKVDTALAQYAPASGPGGTITPVQATEQMPVTSTSSGSALLDSVGRTLDAIVGTNQQILEATVRGAATGAESAAAGAQAGASGGNILANLHPLVVAGLFAVGLVAFARSSSRR